ncbi:NapC/NirT family cytochrome c [Roseovarius sp. 2305UL8-3]|uniref:NapC/NirT family cytochrome c n=1 Tax=Roseovarius conchicola TaxID=3121636 RepID=UPI003528DB0F
MSAENPGFIRRLWRSFRSPTGAYSLGSLLIVGFVVGVVFWGGFHTAMEATNTEKFCISCHEMKENVFAEYEGTIHQNNHSGVRATCPDCHVPKAWGPKVVRKIQATKELYGHFIGIIDTPEKFEAHRLEMATRVWAAMKRTDSRECRNCHNFDYMDLTQQETRAADNHQRGFDAGQTCIDCHQGIAHELPEDWMDGYEGVLDDLAKADLLPPVPSHDVAQADDIRSYVGAD